MPQVRLFLPEELAQSELVGRSLAAHWSAVLGEAGLTSPGDPTPMSIVVDGRFPLSSAMLRGLLAEANASEHGAVLFTVDGAVVASAGASASAEGPPVLPAANAVRVSVGVLHGVDTPWGRSAFERHMVDQRLRELASAGVQLVDPSRIWVECGVAVEAGAVLWGPCTLLGTTNVGPAAVVHPGAWLRDTSVGKGAEIKPHSVCDQAVVGMHCSVGPCAHLRPGAILEADVRVGNFVEVKKSTLRERVRAGHLSYIGDSDVGAGTNVGAGTITVNYDGFGKHRTEIGPGAFIGSNTALVAPITIGAGAFVAAGSTITRSLPDDALAVERAEERVLEGRAKRLRERYRQRAQTKKDG